MAPNWLVSGHEASTCWVSVRLIIGLHVTCMKFNSKHNLFVIWLRKLNSRFRPEHNSQEIICQYLVAVLRKVEVAQAASDKNKGFCHWHSTASTRPANTYAWKDCIELVHCKKKQNGLHEEKQRSRNSPATASRAECDGIISV